MNRVLVPLLIVGMVGCAPKVEVDENELELTASSIAEFDPANSIIPFPNNLLFSETGLLNIPAGCNETATTATLRSVLLNGIDGFAMNNAPIYATFNQPVDVSTVAGNVKLYDMSDGSTLDVYALADTTLRWDSTCSMQSAVDRLMMSPVKPLKDDTYYAVVIGSGLKAASGESFKASATWGFVRQATNPVQIENVTAEDGTMSRSVVKNHTPFNPADAEGMASIEGIDLLWNTHSQLMSFAVDSMGHVRSDIILAWGFKTQSADVALDANVPGSPANTAVAQAGAMNITSEINSPAAIEQHLLAELDGYWGTWARNQNNYGTDDRWIGQDAAAKVPWACGDNDDGTYTWTTPCSSIGAIVHGNFRSPKFQNPELFDLWIPALNPPIMEYQNIEMVGFIPAGTAPAGGWPTVIWAHGIGDSKEQAYTVASVFNKAGIALVATDWVKSGVRADQVVVDEAAGCPPGLVRPGNGQDQCFNGTIDGNPGTLRDNLRQSVVDGHAFIHALRTSCDADNGGCGNLAIDTDNMGYFGHSLGGYLGQPLLGTLKEGYEFKSVVLNVTGVSWRDVLERMTNKKWPCFLINALIDAGTIEGEVWDGNDDVTAFCVAEEWQIDPAVNALLTPFSWLADAAEPGIFADAITSRHSTILIQESVSDATVDNSVTEEMASLLGIEPTTVAADAIAEANSALEQNQLYLKYQSEQGVADFTHASAKVPEPYATCLWDTAVTACSVEELANIEASKQGVRQMQADYIQFLVNHLTSGE
ncbi:MAG: hypothetical protein HOK28_17870 [Deltaproteobacteria bacterium]|nr:hypothetical protein [Deltaproteobacteria bacterium]